MLLLSFLAAHVGLTFAFVPSVAQPKGEDYGAIEGRQSRYPAHTIDMPIDHFPHSNRYEPHANETFQQRYFFDATYYKPGGPVFLYIAGEVPAEYRFSNLQTGIIQILMQVTNGLGVILENRYYGKSFPFNSSTTDELVYMTTEQTIADNAYFASHATFPGVQGNLTAPSTPWILYGGSLAGAQTAFSLKTYDKLLYGGLASSATILGVVEYPQWYDPIQKYGPSDCVSSINDIVEKINQVLRDKNPQAIQELKTIFGLQDLSDNRDFAATIAFPLGGPFNYPTSTWQELNWNPAYGSDQFWQFCSNVTNLNAPEEIASIDYALAEYTNGEPWNNLGNYANYIKNVIIPTCGGAPINSSDCFGTQNPNVWAATSNSGGRSYLYTTCTEQGTFQVSPSRGPALVASVLKADYTQQWCKWAFPPGKYNSIPSKPDVSKWNVYGGYNLTADRLAFIDGTIDPWLDICYHSNSAPLRVASNLHPEHLIAGAGHHWDSYGIGNIAAEPQFIQQAHLWEIRTVQRWLKEWTAPEL